MMINRRNFSAGCIGSTLFGGTFAQSPKWPTKYIRMVVAGAAGSGIDNFARVICTLVAKEIGQSIVLDNKAGANGIIATESVTKSAPDGYTMLFSNASSIVVNEALGMKLPYKLSNLAPIIQLSAGGVLLVAASHTGVKTIKQLIDHMSRHPGQTYGSWGIGSTGHIVMEWLARRANLNVQHVPYKALPQILLDMRGGILDFAFVDSRSALASVQAGSVFPVAVSGSRRVMAFPDTPTMAEQGFPMEADGWYGIFAPAGTPESVLFAMNAATADVLRSEEAKEQLKRAFISPPPEMNPREFSKSIQRDLQIWTDAVRLAKIEI